MSSVHVYAAGIRDVLPTGPSWAHFEGFGGVAKIVLAVIWAAGLAYVSGKTIWGASQQHIGGKRGYVEEAEHGKAMFRSGLTGVFILGSITAILVAVYAISVAA